MSLCINKLLKYKTNFKTVALILDSIDIPTLCNSIKAMDYRDFLFTSYWRYVRHIKIRQAKCKCQMCGKKHTLLNIHHKTYIHHGLEHLYLNDLIVLCEKCHKKIHGK